jgi:hypothetical protein
MAGIQLIGKDSVVEAYNELDGEMWAIFEGKELRIYGTDDASLASWLDRFMPAGSTASYKLRVYDTEQRPINQATPYIASIDFKLHDPYQGAGIHGYGAKISERLDKLEKRDNGEESEWDMEGAVMGWLKDPEKLDTVIGAVRKLFGYTPLPQIPQTMQTMGGTTKPSVLENESLLNRLSAAISDLEKADPRLLEHLEKLALLSASDPALFKSIIAKIDLL